MPGETPTTVPTRKGVAVVPASGADSAKLESVTKLSEEQLKVIAVKEDEINQLKAKVRALESAALNLYQSQDNVYGQMKSTAEMAAQVASSQCQNFTFTASIPERVEMPQWLQKVADRVNRAAAETLDFGDFH